MKYKGIVGHGRRQRYTPAVKLLSIVTDKRKHRSDWSHVLPKHEITDKEKSWQMIAASHQMYSVKALVDLKEWKNVHGKDSTYTLNRDIVWAKAECARELALNFKSNGSRRICAIFNRHAIYDHSYYER
jgi:hypothetical protein